MRNPFARAAKRETARPTLKERAASLKATAGRVIRRKAAEGVSLGAETTPSPASVSPELAAMVAEWVALTERQENESLSDEESAAVGAQWHDLQGTICQFRARSVADLCAKAPIYEYEWNDESSGMPRRAWGSVLQDMEALSASPAMPLGDDPILAMIEEGRRLLRMSDTAFAIAQHPDTGEPPAEQDQAHDALWGHVDSAILRTVPRTAAGCRELARFAEEYAESQGVPISDDERAITSLIAKSPFMTTRPVPMGEADGSGFVTYEDTAGRTRREPVAHWIAATAMNLECIARREVSRQFNAVSNDLPRDECDALYDRLRKEYRIDALHDLAFHSERVFEACKEFAVGHRWVALDRKAASDPADGFPDFHALAITLDLTSADLWALAAIHDAALVIGGVANGLSCQPCSLVEDDVAGKKWGPAGLFADGISEACNAVLSLSEKEARKRVPKSKSDCGRRLGILAKSTIEDGLPKATLALAHEIAAMASR